jgi:hypothetical protein
LRTPLVQIDVGAGQVAAIWRSGDGAVHWTPDAGALELQYPARTFAAQVPVGVLVAGEMPAGAVSVEVFTHEPAREVTVGGGMFLALLEGSEHLEIFYIFRDAAGDVVRASAGKELKRQPLAGGDAWGGVCLACGNTGGWDLVHLRAPPGAPTTQLAGVVCRVCGRPESGFGNAGRRRGPQPEPEPDTREPSEIVAAASHPVYAVEAEGFDGGALVGWERNADPPSYIRLSFYAERSGRRMWVEVLSEHVNRKRLVELSDDRRLRLEVRGVVQLREWGALEDATPEDQLDELLRGRIAFDRELELEVAALPAAPISVSVDGSPVLFTLVERGSVWAAAARIERTNVLLVGRDIAPAEIALVHIRPEDNRVRPRYPELG